MHGCFGSEVTQNPFHIACYGDLRVRFDKLRIRIAVNFTDSSSIYINLHLRINTLFAMFKNTVSESMARNII